MSLQSIQTKLKANKGQYNDFGKYKYRSCEDILESVKPLLAEFDYSLIITDDIILIGDRYYIKATASLLEQGHNVIVTVSAFAREPLNQKGMSEAQITGATSSYARKYCLNGLFCIDDTKDADTMDNRVKQQSKPTGKDFFIKMKGYAKAEPEIYKKTLKFWQVDSAIKITNPEAQQKIMEAIKNKIKEN